MAVSSSPPPALDPPFRGYIETTYDALLVFEAARRGMIPRVTRRLIERERGMVQSGAVFVFDEHESGIKRWTDGLVWSPSRILGNFLVYRETDKAGKSAPTPMSSSANPPASTSPSQHSPSSLHGHQAPGQGGTMPPPQVYQDHHSLNRHHPLGHGALNRPRSDSDGGGSMDRQRERQLVGSLTSSYKFKDGGLVKKTMSVTINGFAQHMISYYSVDDVLNGKLRSPSTVPELSSLEISPQYLHKQNFRFPPMIEIGHDGIARYRGEPEEPGSPTSPATGLPMHSYQTSSDYDSFAHGAPPPHQAMRFDQSPRHRSTPTTIPIPIHSPVSSHSYGPSSATSSYFEQPPMNSPLPLARQNTGSSVSNLSAMRPGSSHRRYDPYGPSSPRSAHSAPSRRQSQPSAPLPPGSDYGGYGTSPLDIKPALLSPITSNGSYHYQPPASAPAAFADFDNYAAHPPTQAGTYAPQYGSWQPPPSGRYPITHPREYVAAPPSSSGSSHSGNPQDPSAQPGLGNGEGWAAPMAPPGSWSQGYAVQESSAEWRDVGTGTSVG